MVRIDFLVGKLDMLASLGHTLAVDVDLVLRLVDLCVNRLLNVIVDVLGCHLRRCVVVNRILG